MAGLAAVAVWSLCVGVAPIGLAEVLTWLQGRADSQTALILGQLRLPRILLAAEVGAVLALTGVLSQTLFRNPLADPALVGIGAGAALGASLWLALPVALFIPDMIRQWFSVPVAAFAGGLGAGALVLRFATVNSSLSVSGLLLAGLALTFFAGAVTGLLDYWVDERLLRRISMWRMGGVDSASWTGVVVLAVVTMSVAVIAWRLIPWLDTWLLGESDARWLGTPVARLKWLLMALMAAGVGAAVAAAGNVAFVGLLVPQAARLLVGAAHRVVLPLAGVLGAALLVGADTLARIAVAPAELPLGLVTSLVGAPVFILMLQRELRGGRLL